MSEKQKKNFALFTNTSHSFVSTVIYYEITAVHQSATSITKYIRKIRHTEIYVQVVCLSSTQWPYKYLLQKLSLKFQCKVSVEKVINFISLNISSTEIFQSENTLSLLKKQIWKFVVMKTLLPQKAIGASSFRKSSVDVENSAWSVEGISNYTCPSKRWRFLLFYTILELPSDFPRTCYWVFVFYLRVL